MSTIASTTTTVQSPYEDTGFDEAQLAAAAFLARYSGRTLEAYRHDLRGFFQWPADHGIAVLAATRPHVELWRGSMEERGLAASTIDRRLSTVCGFYRFAHIDGRISSNPAEYVRRPHVHRPPPHAHGDRSHPLSISTFMARGPPGPRRAGSSRWDVSQSSSQGRPCLVATARPGRRSRPSGAADLPFCVPRGRQFARTDLLARAAQRRSRQFATQQHR